MGIMILIASLPPKGQAGCAGGYKLIDALRLLEKKYKYNVLLDLMHKLTYQYLDTSHSLTHQSDKLLVKKVIQKAQSKSDILMCCEGGWGAHDLIAQVLKNRLTAECRQRQNTRAKVLSIYIFHYGDDNDDDVNRPIKDSKVHRHPQKKRKRVKLDNEDGNDDNDNVNRSIKGSKVHRCPQKKTKQVKLDDDDDDDDDDNDNDQGDIDYNNTKDEDNLEEEDDH
ncbi:hypothetical protein J3A83DRAFT_4367717 [Scleroderma citrinum]